MIKVNKSTCLGCGACVSIDPEHFDFDSDGLSEVISNEVTDATQEAKAACPVDAISIETNENAQVINEEETQTEDIAA